MSVGSVCFSYSSPRVIVLRLREEANSAFVTVTVKVSVTLGNAVANARVHFLERWSKSRKEQTTDETGTATVQLQPGSLDLSVTSPRPDLMSVIVRDVEVKRGALSEFHIGFYEDAV